MMTKTDASKPVQGDLFKVMLRDLVAPGHELVLLRDAIDWERFEKALEPAYCSDNGRPAIPVRMMAGLTFLKYMFGLSDQDVLDSWCENPYWQYFCGGEFFEHEPPTNQATMSRWQGREYSHAAGLYNFRARWYDPAAGRWLSKDPIGLEGGLNLYEAFGNNPVCFMDPLGYSFFGTCWSGIRTGATAVYDASAAVGGVVVDAAAAVGKVTADVAGKTWAAGNTAIGVVAGGVIGGGFIPGIGAEMSIGNNAIQFENVWFMRWGSITLGNCILYEYGENANSPCTEGRLCDHERQHTYQAEVLGPFYLFAHLYYGLKAVILDKDWHGDSNILEKGPQSIPPRPWWW